MYKLLIKLPKNHQSGIEPEIYIRSWFLMISLLHFFITTYTDSIIFSSVDYISFPIYFIAKIIVFVLLALFWQTVPVIYNRLKSKNEDTICFIKHFGIYFLIMLIFLFLTWPGVWRWDDLFIADYASKLMVSYWHHWITYIFYIISFSVIPFPAGVVFFQILIISLSVGWVSYRMFKVFKPKFQWFLLILMLFPSVINNNLYPMRLCLYAHLVFLLLSSIVLKYESQKDITKYDIVLWGVLTAITASWRTESLFFIIVIPVVLLITFRKRLHIKSVICYVLIAVTLTAGIMKIQKTGEANESSQDYSLTAILSPLSAIIKTDFKSDDPNRDLERIDRVISVESLLKEDGITVFWTEGTRSYTQEDLNNLMKVYLKLVINNFSTFLKNQWQLFSHASGLVRNASNSIGNSAYIFTATDEEIYDTFRENYIFNQPVNKQLRKNVISILECRSFYSYETTTVLYPVLYNVLIPIAILIFVVIYGFIRKRRIYAVLSLLVLVQTGLIFATAPSAFFMYYFPTYICGYGLGILFYLSLRYENKIISRKA